MADYCKTKIVVQTSELVYQSCGNVKMVRLPRSLEKEDYEWFNLETPLTFPASNQHLTKTEMKFSVNDRNLVRDWFNAYFLVEYSFEALANGANVAAQSALINSAFSLIKKKTSL